MPRKAAGAGAVKDAKSEPGVAAKATKAKGKGAAVGKGQAATKATPVNPADKVAELKELEERRRQMKEQLLQVEAQGYLTCTIRDSFVAGITALYTHCGAHAIYTLESQYLEKANPRGNALKGAHYGPQSNSSYHSEAFAGVLSMPSVPELERFLFLACTGYEGLLTSVAGTVKKGAPKAEDRIFSGSSVTGRPK
eukprot:366056-Chlamydomonas_euryale.AAC.5